MQPTLAPAPAASQHHLSSPNEQVEPSTSSNGVAQALMEGWVGQQDPHAAEQVAAIALRAHLFPNIHSPSKGNSQSPDQAGSVTSHDENINIDPAISGVGNIAGQPPPPIIGIPQQSQQHTQPAQQAPIPDGSQNMGSMSPDIQQSSTEAAPNSPPKRGGKRELSTSKRAAQNRAAQRAFRQRKEGYIKKLEEQVRDLNALEESYKQIQNENYQLRDYIISLQSRLIESQGEDAVPPAPILIAHQTMPQQALLGAQVPQHSTMATVVAPPQQGAPTANMGIAAPSATHHHQAPQMAQGMMGAPITQSVPSPTENGQQKRSLEEENAAFNGFVAKKLKGAAAAAEMEQAQAAAAVAAAAVGPTSSDPKQAEVSVNGNAS